MYSHEIWMSKSQLALKAAAQARSALDLCCSLTGRKSQNSSDLIKMQIGTWSYKLRSSLAWPGPSIEAGTVRSLTWNNTYTGACNISTITLHSLTSSVLTWRLKEIRESYHQTVHFSASLNVNYWIRAMEMLRWLYDRPLVSTGLTVLT